MKNIFKIKENIIRHAELDSASHSLQEIAGQARNDERMKKILFILALIICNTYFVFSQTYILGGITSPCYSLGNNLCYTSHGSPGPYPVSHGNYYVLFASNAAGKTEGMFIYYNFNENRKYRIIITLQALKGSPGIEVYAANGLTKKIDTTHVYDTNGTLVEILCKLGTIPTTNIKKDLIGKEPSAPYNYSLPSSLNGVYFPATSSPDWNPDTNYSQLWIYSKATTDSSAFVVSEIRIQDCGNVIPPGIPQNPRVANANSKTITVQWNASTKGDYDIDKYEIFRGNTSVGTTTNTQFTVTNLTPCTEYKIDVQAIDVRKNRSPKESVNTKTTPDGNVVLNSPIILSPYKEHVESAENYIQFNPGFSVSANGVGERFRAIVGGCP